MLDELDKLVKKITSQYMKKGLSPKRAENMAWAVAQRQYREKNKKR